MVDNMEHLSASPTARVVATEKHEIPNWIQWHCADRELIPFGKDDRGIWYARTLDGVIVPVPPQWVLDACDELDWIDPYIDFRGTWWGWKHNAIWDTADCLGRGHGDVVPRTHDMRSWRYVEDYIFDPIHGTDYAMITGNVADFRFDDWIILSMRSHQVGGAATTRYRIEHKRREPEGSGWGALVVVIDNPKSQHPAPSDPV